ncbi:MAG: 50S ribosomal protein L9 [Nitrospirota bacterium]
MKVILKEDVDNLGIIGTVVDVAKGYGRNYLIPRNLAVEANPNNLKQFEHQKKMIHVKADKIKIAAGEYADKISEISITIEARAGEGDKLFGSVTTMDIAEAISKKGIEVDKRKIVLAEPIKRLGTYDVSVKVRQDVTATVKVEVKQDSTVEEAAKAEVKQEVTTEETAETEARQDGSSKE